MLEQFAASNAASASDKMIAVIGLGYVGLPLAAEFGKRRPVIGYDVKSRRVSQLREGVDTTREVTAEDLRNATHLEFTHNRDELARAQIYIVTVPTPIDAANRPDLSPLIKASETIGRYLKKGDIVVYESTVYPGCTEEICVPALEAQSGLRFNVDFFCGYSPERINPGDKVNTLTKIRKITSGSTPEAAAEIAALYGEIISAGTFQASSIKVAEAAKVIENSQRDLNIAFVNELSVIFERIGIDTIEVLEAAGSKWNFLPFRPGMVGGHCIGVDPYYLTHKAEELGYHPQIILAGRRMNDNMARYAARNIIRRMLQNGHDVVRSTIGVLGLTFKENCPDIRNSKIVDLVRELRNWNVNTLIADAWADPEEVRHEYGLELTPMSEMRNLDGVIVAVGHNEFRNLQPGELFALCSADKRPVLGDLKALYDRHAATQAGFTVFRL